MYAPNHICGDIGNVGFFRKVSSECTAKQGILKILINGEISTHVQTPASSLALDPTTFNLSLYFQTRAKRESYTSIRLGVYLEKGFQDKQKTSFCYP